MKRALFSAIATFLILSHMAVLAKIPESSTLEEYIEHKAEQLVSQSMEESFVTIEDINSGHSTGKDYCPVSVEIEHQSDPDTHPFQLPETSDGEEIEAWSHCTGRLDPKGQRSKPGASIVTPKDFLHNGFLNLPISDGSKWGDNFQKCGLLPDNIKQKIVGKDVHNAIDVMCQDAPTCEDMRNDLASNYKKAYESLPKEEQERMPDWESFKNLFKKTQFDTQNIFPKELPKNMLFASMYVLSKGNFLQKGRGVEGAFQIPSIDDGHFALDTLFMKKGIPTVRGDSKEDASYHSGVKNIDDSMLEPGVSAIKFVRRLQRGWVSIQDRFRTDFENLPEREKWHMALYSALHPGNVGSEYFDNMKTFNEVTQCNSCKQLYSTGDCGDIKRSCGNPGENTCGETIGKNGINFERMLSFVRKSYTKNKGDKMHCLGKIMRRTGTFMSNCDMALIHVQLRNIMRLSQCKL